MKQQFIMIIMLALMLVSQYAMAGSISDSYATGDVLTAAKMDNIKSAVNDNNTQIGTKQNRVNGFCTGTDSLKAINQDGTVNCQSQIDTLSSLVCVSGEVAKWDGAAWICAPDTDSDSGGDITEVTAGAGLTGGGTSGSVTLSLSTQTRYLSLPGNACIRDPGAPPYWLGDRGLFCALIDASETSNLQAIWPVNLPNKSTILGMRAWVFTVSGTTTCNLYSGTDNFGTDIAEISDAQLGWHYTPETIISHNVDTENKAYYVLCRSDSGTPSSNNAIGHIRIRYTY